MPSGVFNVSRKYRQHSAVFLLCNQCGSKSGACNIAPRFVAFCLRQGRRSHSHLIWQPKRKRAIYPCMAGIRRAVRSDFWPVQLYWKQQKGSRPLTLYFWILICLRKAAWTLSGSCGKSPKDRARRSSLPSRNTWLTFFCLRYLYYLVKSVATEGVEETFRHLTSFISERAPMTDPSVAAGVGYGLKSIEHTARKYGGDAAFRFDEKEKTFNSLLDFLSICANPSTLRTAESDGWFFSKNTCVTIFCVNYWRRYENVLLYWFKRAEKWKRLSSRHLPFGEK